ncbi:MAG: hypothetical protein ABJN22_13680 [Litorimonas sp.]
MNEDNLKPNVLFWILGVIFLLWNLMGCGIYLMDTMMSDAAYLDAYGAEMAAAREFYPTWATAFYAIAVWGGLVAAVLFLMRRGLSVTLFAVSLVAAVICFIPNFTNEVIRDASGSTFWMMPLIVVVLGIVEVLYSRKQASKGILR